MYSKPFCRGREKRDDMLYCSEEVREALAEGRAVVALESTIISHGMPWPQNAETAFALEALVREQGAVPATVALTGGQLKVGLQADEIERLARKGQEVVKCSLRDLAVVLQRGQWGATTVAATLFAAGAVGIRFFATGGIGGVHRGAERSMDVSADLPQLARSQVALVSAGAKAVLDLARTLEYLETLGVPVIGYGTKEFPAFYTRSSGLPLLYRYDVLRDLAKALKKQWSLSLPQGVLIANPIPKEYEPEAAPLQAAVERALEEAFAQGLGGKELTPFLLERIRQLTGGLSLSANIRLVENNVRLASRLAVEYAGLPA